MLAVLVVDAKYNYSVIFSCLFVFKAISSTSEVNLDVPIVSVSFSLSLCLNTVCIKHVTASVLAN